jgi:8-oxoguanine deaminase
VQQGEVILADSQRLIQTYHQRGDGAQIQIALAPCSPFSVTQEIMRQSAELAEQWDVRLHTHLAETLDEEAFCLQRFGLRTVDYLDSVGWLGPRTWLAHGIHFTPDEIERLGAAGTGICHCPSSNMRLASGICPTLDLAAAGAQIGLGVDGSASNDGSNMILEARQALYLQRLRYGAERITPELVLGWASKGSAALLGRNDIGELAVGKQADLAMFKLDELRFSGSHDPISALLLCGADKADRMMIGGQWRVIDGQIEGLDVAQLIADHRQAAKELIVG